MANHRRSEVHAYRKIINELLANTKGWNKSKIYTQQECLEVPEIKRLWKLDHPENVIEITPKSYYVIEAKNERKKLEQALREAREDYADKLNESQIIKALFITGIAGNDQEGFIARSEYYKNGKWEVILENDVEVTGLLSSLQVQKIIESDDPHLRDVEISEDEFLSSAEKINEILHINAIEKQQRARFISALLLSISEKTDLDLSQSTTELVNSINTRVKVILSKHRKEEFARYIQLDIPSNIDNHDKYKRAIVDTYQQLLSLNIRSAMKSGKDVLGQFYEVFLKYGNGAKEIGIVLTPRHVTRFVADVLDIQYDDLVLDPACGTGGFLVAALDEVRRKEKDPKKFERFRLHGLYGIEEKDYIVVLSIVNMIFRGDGKNEIVEGNCFKKWYSTSFKESFPIAQLHPFKKDEEGNFIDLKPDKDRIPPMTKVMMNPPFALDSSDEKEYHFVEHALEQMDDGGILFSVLPLSVLIEDETKTWRRDVLLKQNTLIAVITFPEDLFYPIGVNTAGIFIKRGKPHNFNKDLVYFARCTKDGFIKKKGKRVHSKNEPDLLNSVRKELKEFITHPDHEITSVPEFKKTSPLRPDDDDVELVPETYVESSIISEVELEEGIDKMIRDKIAFEIKYHEKLKK